MTKPQARELARRFGLEVADKQDSQDICFVPTGRYTDIIGRLKPDAIEPGDIVDLDGRVHRPASGHRSFHRRPAQGTRHRLRRAALCRQARCRQPPRRGRPARGAADGSHPAARRQLDRRRRARSRDRRRHRDVRARALDARAAAGLAARGRRRLRGRTRRRRRGRLARPGLRVLRCAFGTGARARRRIHQERDRANAAARAAAQRNGCAPLAEAMRG